MVIADIAYNESDFPVFLIDVEKHIPLCSLVLSERGIPQIRN